jgi:hypothetical protein
MLLQYYRNVNFYIDPTKLISGMAKEPSLYPALFFDIVKK